MNQAWADFTGLTVNDALSMRLGDSVHPDDQAQRRASAYAAMAARRPFRSQYRVRNRDGAWRWLDESAAPRQDHNGVHAGFIGACSDITEIIEARAQSYRLSRKLEQTLDHLSDAFFTLDREWRFTFVNAEAARLLQRAPRELIGHNVWDKFPAAIGGEYQRQYEQAMSRHETVQFTAHYAPLDLWTQVTAYPTPEGLAIHFQDVGERLAAQERLRLLGG